MTISDKDRDFMKEVTSYFLKTKTPLEPDGSIRDTADHFQINRNKVRKILITAGVLTSPYTEKALSLRRKGMTIKEIADELKVSTATVSMSLPYTDKIDNTLEPSSHTEDVRSYRAYEKQQRERQAGRGKTEGKKFVKDWQKDISMSYEEDYNRPPRTTWDDIFEQLDNIKENGADDKSFHQLLYLQGLIKLYTENEDENNRYAELAKRSNLSEDEKNELESLRYKTGRYLGALNKRNIHDLEYICSESLPPEPISVMRLHMELYAENYDENISDILKKYGHVQYGDTISRDMIVPSTIPLYALHYAIQRAFGWQNSHLREFSLPKDRFIELTENNVGMWAKLVGVLFRSPYMDETDQFWADDYEGGSFKNWLRNKYTGPYMSQCIGEDYLSCRKDMSRLDMDQEYYVLYIPIFDRETNQYKEYISSVEPVYDQEGKKLPEPEPLFPGDKAHRVEIMPLKDVPSEGVEKLFFANPEGLLERLPLFSVLSSKLPSYEKPKGLQFIPKGSELYKLVSDQIEDICREQNEDIMNEVYTLPVTDTLLYCYDFGDNWKIRITASEDCTDLIKSGRITQAELDRANIKCREVYRPVLIARDGDMVMDDVGGIYGFVSFLKTINPDLTGMDPEEIKEVLNKKDDLLNWSKIVGWKAVKTKNINLL